MILKTIDCPTWGHFDKSVSTIADRKKDLEAAAGGRQFYPPVYRGLGNCSWGLQTTLDRAYPQDLAEPITHFVGYYFHAFKAKAAIETFTDQQWDIPNPFELRAELSDSRPLPSDFFNDNLSVYRYFVYLRHHGFPSPLLDWTASPYIAAFFAFDAMDPGANKVSIYAILRNTTTITSTDVPEITLLGPHIRSHRRHMVQQSRYTICTQWESGLRICSHDDAMTVKHVLGIDGEAIKIDIPATERLSALRTLDLMNINSYSLYGSEESLMHSIARRNGLNW